MEGTGMEMVLGAQLYTVRLFTQSERDLDVTLRRCAEIGYSTVQISAIGDIAPQRVRQLCDRHGLKIALTHTNPERILRDTEAVIREHDEMGCDYIGMGMMPERYRSPAWIERFALDYIEPARKIAAAGKLLMYHNHALEFAKIGGRHIMDILTDAFAPGEMGVTLDTYWLQVAGGDVCHWIGRLADRMPCVHLKDVEALLDNTCAMAPVLEGTMNFRAILAALEKAGGTKYLLVEQDVCRESPFACLEKSYRNLSALGYR
jgi:sugar phosphate isomerase/epimerase